MNHPPRLATCAPAPATSFRKTSETVREGLSGLRERLSRHDETYRRGPLDLLRAPWPLSFASVTARLRRPERQLGLANADMPMRIHERRLRTCICVRNGKQWGAGRRRVRDHNSGGAAFKREVAPANRRARKSLERCLH